jgi:hypothetical protein
MMNMKIWIILYLYSADRPRVELFTLRNPCAIIQNNYKIILYNSILKLIFRTNYKIKNILIHYNMLYF